MSAFRGNPEYLTEVDRMLERAKEVTRYGKYTGIEYARFADDLVILVDAHPRHDWLMTAVEKRLRKELAALQVEVNEEKSRIVDLGRGESFGFLGFDFRRIRSGRGVWRAHFTPKLKKRTAPLRKLKDAFHRHQSQPVDQLDQPDPTWLGELLRGWARQRVLWLHSRLGGKEGSAPSDEGSEAKGLRLGAVE
jgi:RNA-directed DNA polymerase